MSPQRRIPRSFQSEAIAADAADLPAVSPHLVEWLERQFTVRLSPIGEETTDQAEQRGQQQVIERLRTLSLNQE